MRFWEQIRAAIYSATINARTTQSEIARRAGMQRTALNKFMRSPESGLTPKHLDGVLSALRLRVEVLRK